MSFRLKTIIGLLLIQGCLIALLIFVSQSVLNESAQEGISKRASTTSHLLAALAKDSVLSYDIATLETYVAEIMLEPEMSYIRIIDRTNNILAQSGEPSVLSRAFKKDIHVSSVEDGIFDTTTTIEVNDVIFGRIEMGLDINFVTQLNDKTRQSLFFVSVFALLGTLFFAFFLGRYLTRQLTALMNASKALAKGNLNYRVNVIGHDELSKTAHTFNEMADKLDELYRNLDKEIGINQAMFVTSPSAIVITDSQGMITSFNGSAEKIFGYSADEVIDKNISILMQFDDAQKHDGHIQRYLETGIEQAIGTGREVMAQHKNGDIIPIYLAVGKMQVHDEQMYVGMINDISARKKSEQALKVYRDNLELLVSQRTEELELARDSAEAGAQTKAAFIANMSHEIRTPMNSIIGFAEVLLSDVTLGKDSRRQIETILSSGRSLLNIINDILDISKLESGKFSLENVCFNLPNSLSQALKLVEQQATEKSLTLSLNVEESLPSRYMGDPTRLRQVILNLVGNAIKFTLAGSVQVNVGKHSKNDMLHFSISDTGIGMSEEQIEKVFHSFVQADASTTRKFGGTGLGTTISRQIVELMGGEIWIESKPGVGSVFHFTATLTQPTDEQDCLYDNEHLVIGDYVSPRLFNILLAEDIETNADLVMLRLAHQGHHVDWVKNGHEAINASNQKDYDLVLMDVMMPELDGLDATRAIRLQEKSSKKHIPIVALTASVMREDHERCRMAGMDRIESKPINFNNLLTTIEDVVQEGHGDREAKLPVQHLHSIRVDFLPVAQWIDIAEAMALWREDKILANALLNFAEQRVEDADLMRQLLVQNPTDFGPAKNIAHSLKGLAGNLMMTKIADFAIAIDDNLKAGQHQEALTNIDRLEPALQEAASAIRQLNVIENKQDTPLQEFDKQQVQQLLTKLFITLNEFSPDAAEPILTDLENYIAKQDLQIIHKNLESFDFSQAQTSTRLLAKKFDITIE